MIIFLSNSGDQTVDYLEHIVKSESIEHVRLDTDKIIDFTSFSFNGLQPVLFTESSGAVSPHDVLAIWYRRPERLRSKDFTGRPEEKFAIDEWSEALEGFFALVPEERWINFPARNVNASHKIEQLVRARKFGLRVPDTIVTQNPDAFLDFYSKNKERVIVKPLSYGCFENASKEVESLIYTNVVGREKLAFLDELRFCPVLVQAFVRKALDVRITYLDGHFHTVTLVSKEESGEQVCDIRRDNMERVAYASGELPEDVRESLLGVIRSYKLRFAAIDMAVDSEGDWIFFEINPNGQWAWLDIVGAASIHKSFIGSFRALK